MFTQCQWKRGDYNDYHAYLLSLGDEKYRDFNRRLLPGVKREMIGVRLPELRKIAKDILKGNPKKFLAKAPEVYYEDILVQALVIAGLKEDLAVILNYIKDFVPKIDNWATCDTFVSALHIVKKHRDELYTFFVEYLHNPHEYQVRFGIVALMNYYLEDNYIDDVLTKIDSVTHPRYYVKMAQAWAVSMAYVKYPEKTVDYFRVSTLDDWTYNKALQKITESNRVAPEAKADIRLMKRKI